MNLSPHFTLEEMIRSESAIRHGIDNTPNETQRKNLLNLCVNVLEPLRMLLNKPIHVTSGFRNPTVNSLIGGALSSQHMKGEAADISVEGLTTEELFLFIINSGLPFDQVIQEFNAWVHISYKKTNRHEALRATKNAQNKTVYTKA